MPLPPPPSPTSMLEMQHAIERIVGLIGYLDYCLENYRPGQKHQQLASSQWEGLFRISPNEAEFQSWVGLTENITTHQDMKAFLQTQPESSAIQLSARLLKHLLSKLDFPVFPMDFAVETLEEEDLAVSGERALLGSILADSFLHSVACNVPERLGASYCVMGAQLFALMRHVSLEFAKTKMDEYNLCVVLLPSVAGTRMDDKTTMECMMHEAQMLKQFQANHREGKHCRFELLVKYGRRIWGVVHSLSIDANALEGELREIRARVQRPAPQHQQQLKSQVASMFQNARKHGSMALHRASISASIFTNMAPQATSPPPAPAVRSTALPARSAATTTLPPLTISRQESKPLTEPSALQQQPHSPAISKALANSSRRRLSRGDSLGSDIAVSASSKSTEAFSSPGSANFPPLPKPAMMRQLSNSSGGGGSGSARSFSPHLQ